VLFILGGLVGLLAGLVAGGRITHLAEIRFRWPLVVVVAFAARELNVLYTPLAHSWLAPVFYTVALAALVVWTAWHRDRVPGIIVVAAGMGLNLVVVIANLGHMPVPLWLADRGPHELIERGELGQYIVMGPNTHLNWLGDWIVLPGTLGHIFTQAYSPGDLVATVGMGVAVFLSMRPGVALTTH
jgi:Family of unknown function (DUF5317)